MRFAKAGMAVVAMASVAAFAAALMPEFRGIPASTRISGSSQPVLAATPAAAIRVNGSQPRIPIAALKLSGEVVGLAPQSTGLAVTVTVGGQTYLATVQGNKYSANIGRPSPLDMVIVEAKATRVHYRSVLGSADRLRMLAGSDSQVVVAEHSSLRVSPYSTALSWLVRFALGGRDAASVAEFEQAMRSAANRDLETVAYALSAAASGEWPLPAGFSNGYQLLQARDAFRNYVEQSGFQLASQGYLFAQQDAAPVKSISEIPDRLVMIDGVPYAEMPLTAGNLFLLHRKADGSVDLHENKPLVDPNYAIGLDSDGVVGLQPNGAGVRTYDRTAPSPGIIQRTSLGHSLRRLTLGQDVSIWAVRSVWRDVDLWNPGATPVTLTEYRTLSSTALAAWSRSDGWPGTPGLRRTLPWMCMQVGGLSQSSSLAECDYVKHAINSFPASYTVEHGWSVDEQMQPQVAFGTEDFTWSLDAAQGVLRIVNAQTDTSFWRLAGQYRSLGPVLYLASGRDDTGAVQTMVGMSLTMVEAIDSLPADAAVGDWQSGYSASGAPTYTFRPFEYLLFRDSNGSGTEESRTHGLPVTTFPLNWTISNDGIYDRRITGQFSSGSRYVGSCVEAFNQGASGCASRIRYFKPLLKTMDRYYGIEEIYTQTMYAPPPGQAPSYSNYRVVSRPSFYACKNGACMSGFVYPGSPARVAASLGTLSMMAGAGGMADSNQGVRRTTPGRAAIPRLRYVADISFWPRGHQSERLRMSGIDDASDDCPDCGGVAKSKAPKAVSLMAWLSARNGGPQTIAGSAADADSDVIPETAADAADDKDPGSAGPAGDVASMPVAVRDRVPLEVGPDDTATQRLR